MKGHSFGAANVDFQNGELSFDGFNDAPGAQKVYCSRTSLIWIIFIGPRAFAPDGSGIQVECYRIGYPPILMLMIIAMRIASACTGKVSGKSGLIKDWDMLIVSDV